MDILNSLLAVALAGLIQSGFQLSISVLTILSTQTLGNKSSQRKLVGLSSGFIFGATIMSGLLIISAVYFLSNLLGDNHQLNWTIVCGLLVGIAMSTLFFYYQRGAGTMLWMPKSMADFLAKRAQKASSMAETFSLGLTSIVAELIFIIAPLLATGIILKQLSFGWQVLGMFIYVVTSLLSLIVVWVLILRGHSLARIQRWREKNKFFMQLATGLGLLILAAFIYVNTILVEINLLGIA